MSEKKIEKLTDVAVRQALKGDKDYKLPDFGGLYLFVTTFGRKTWRLKYRHGGKEKRLVLGAYPDLKITDARVRRNEVKALLREGKDPALEEAHQVRERIAGDRDVREVRAQMV